MMKAWTSQGEGEEEGDRTQKIFLEWMGRALFGMEPSGE